MRFLQNLIGTLFTISLFSLTVGAQGHNPVMSECWFTATQVVEGYNDADLTQHKPFVDMQPGMSFQVLEVRGEVALIAIDHAMSFWALHAGGSFSGNCDAIPGYHPEQAIVTDNTRLWTAPDVITGSIITTLTEGTAIQILSPGELGRIRYDSNIQDIWYHVTDGTVTGWIWAGRLAYIPTPLSSVDAITLDNTRLWTHPDVIVGDILYAPPANIGVDIISTPVTGAITYTGDTGTWYQVVVNDIMGWVWEARLEIIE